METPWGDTDSLSHAEASSKHCAPHTIRPNFHNRPHQQNGSGLDDVSDAWIRSCPLRVGRRVADPVVNTTVGRGCSKLTLRRRLSVSKARSQS